MLSFFCISFSFSFLFFSFFSPSPVVVPWLGSHVLYFEEFLHDDPENLRRQLLIKLEPAEPPARGVRARLFTFVRPRAWIHLHLRPNRLASLMSDDVATTPTCDLLFTREGDQFRGSTSGHRCLDIRAETSRYVEYQLLIGQDLYWYRRRLLRKTDGEVQEEVIGFNWFELNTTQLYTCRIDWTASGRPQLASPGRRRHSSRRWRRARDDGAQLRPRRS